MRFKKENEGSRIAPTEDWPLAFRHEYRYIGKKKYALLYRLDVFFPFSQKTFKVWFDSVSP
jgi:hypothetical protein